MRLYPPDIFDGWPVKTGIKFALAGCLSLIAALALRLDEPTWAVTTAFVLSTPKFVGAIAEKTVFRIFGALMGAVIGYLITGSSEQSPVLFIGSMAVLVAFTTTMYGGTFAPYLLRQCGYTATIVAAQGMADPAFSWRVGMARFEEVCVGIVVTSLVTLLVWPRHAYKEFDSGARGVLRSLAEIFQVRSAAFFGKEASEHPMEISWSQTGKRLAALRKLIRVAEFESRSFSVVKNEVDQIVAHLGSLTGAIFDVCKTLPRNSEFFPYLEIPAGNLHRAIHELMAAIADANAPIRRREEALNAAKRALDAYYDALRKFRDEGAGDALTMIESLDHAGYGMAVREIIGSLEELHRVFPLLEAARADGFPRVRLRKAVWPGVGWLKAGIRAGIAVGTALFVVNWAHPPGGDLIVVGTYLFTAFTLESLDPAGDRGAFTWLVQTCLLSTAFFLFLLLTTPLMANALFFFTVLAAMLFATGYYSTKGSWGSLQVLFALLVIVSLVGLNVQMPVSFQQIVDCTLGMALAATLSAFFRRLLWPVLPQQDFHTRLVELLGKLNRLFSAPYHAADTSRRASFVLLGAEVQSLAEFLSRSIPESEERVRLGNYVNALLAAGNHQLFYQGMPSGTLPDDLRERFMETVIAMRTRIAGLFECHARSLQARGGEPSNAVDFEPLPESFFSDIRTEVRSVRRPVEKTMEALAALHHEYEAGAATARAAAAFSQISFPRLLADRIL